MSLRQIATRICTFTAQQGFNKHKASWEAHPISFQLLNLNTYSFMNKRSFIFSFVVHIFAECFYTCSKLHHIYIFHIYISVYASTGVVCARIYIFLHTPAGSFTHSPIQLHYYTFLHTFRYSFASLHTHIQYLSVCHSAPVCAPPGSHIRVSLFK